MSNVDNLVEQFLLSMALYPYRTGEGIVPDNWLVADLWKMPDIMGGVGV